MQETTVLERVRQIKKRSGEKVIALIAAIDVRFLSRTTALP